MGAFADDEEAGIRTLSHDLLPNVREIEDAFRFVHPTELDNVEFARGVAMPYVGKGCQVDTISNGSGVGRRSQAEVLNEIMIIAFDEFGSANDELRAAVEPACGKAFRPNEQASH